MATHLYTGRISFKKFPWLEFFFKAGGRYNMVFWRNNYYNDPGPFEYMTGGSPAIDLGIRLQFVKFKKS